MAAYARQGRHCSARAEISFPLALEFEAGFWFGFKFGLALWLLVRLGLRALITPKSLAGNASGGLKPRIAR